MEDKDDDSGVPLLRLRRPSRNEMAVLLTAIGKDNLDVTIRAVAGVTFFNPTKPDEPMPLPLILGMAVLNWMEQLQLFGDAMTRLRVVMAMREDLDRYAEQLDLLAKENTQNEPWSIESGGAPAGVFTVLDMRWVCVTGGKGLYDYRTALTADKLPHHMLTGITCNLAVLLLRLLAKMQQLRNSAQKPETSHVEVPAAVNRKRKKPSVRKKPAHR